MAIEISEIDNNLLRQGIEINLNFIRGILFPKILPNYSIKLTKAGKLNSYFDDTLIEKINLDDEQKIQSKLILDHEQRDLGQLDFSDSDASRPGYEPFRESTKFNPVEFILTTNLNYPFSILEKQKYSESYYIKDGVLEPFAIRSIADFSCIEEKPFNSIKASLNGEYKEDFEGNACLISDDLDFSNENKSVAFFDFGPNNNSLNKQTMLDTGLFSNERTNKSPFDESNININKINLKSNAGFNKTLTNLNYNLSNRDSIAYFDLLK